MNLPSFEQFQADALARGFDTVVERQWAPHTVLEEHSHPFAVDALVVEGMMVLTMNGQELQLRPGDRFALEAAQPHAERYGHEGATYWVARRNSSAG